MDYDYLVFLIYFQAEKILEDLCRVAMTREDTTQMELELAKMEGMTPVVSTPAHKPPIIEERKTLNIFISFIFNKIHDDDSHIKRFKFNLSFKWPFAGKIQIYKLYT